MKDTTATSYVIKDPTESIDGIKIYKSNNYNEWFEAEYNKTSEPWHYSKRGAELYRHKYTVKQIRTYNTTIHNLLELGCSRGLMTELLIPVSNTLYAADISYTALKACKSRCDAIAQRNNCRIEYFVATAPGLPFDAESFDTVTLCDGLAGWWLSDEQKLDVLKDVFRVLKKGGIAILTDYLMPIKNRDRFKAYETMVSASPLSIVNVSLLYDKPWYLMESLIKRTGLRNKLNSVLSNIRIAKLLNSLGTFIGRKAARHIVMVLRKD